MFYLLQVPPIFVYSFLFYFLLLWVLILALVGEVQLSSLTLNPWDEDSTPDYREIQNFQKLLVIFIQHTVTIPCFAQDPFSK